MAETGMTNTYIGQNHLLSKQLKNTQLYFSKQSPETFQENNCLQYFLTILHREHQSKLEQTIS